LGSEQMPSDTTTAQHQAYVINQRFYQAGAEIMFNPLKAEFSKWTVPILR